MSVHERGRDGTVRYRERDGEIEFFWEFGGGATIAAVAVGTAAEWQVRHPWAADRRGLILERLGRELIRQRAPGCRAVLDEASGTLAIVGAGPSPLADGSPATRRDPARAATFPLTFTRLRARLALYVGVAVAVLAVLAWIGRSLFTIETTGTPWGDSVRAGNTIATLIQRLEPYIPSLHRDHSRDTYSMGLLLHATDGSTAPRYVEVSRGHTASALQLSRFLGADAERLWFRAPEAGAYDLRSGRLLGADALQQAQPHAPRATRTDYAVGDRALLLGLAAGGIVGETRWLGVLSAAEAERSVPRGATAPGIVPFARSSEPRELWVGEVERDGGRQRLARLEARPGAPLHDGGFVRSARDGALLRLADPAGLLLLHQSERHRKGTVVLTRIDDDGQVRWRTDLGIGTLQQVLPDGARPAFVGTRPAVPSQVAEPILVVVDVRRGEATTWSLWWKD